VEQWTYGYIHCCCRHDQKNQARCTQTGTCTSLALHPRTTNHGGIRWFKKQQACLWTAEEIDTAKDIDDFNKLSDPEQSFIKTILAFFASADSIVMDNLMEQFGTEANAFDIKLFFVIQTYIEAVHAETYTNLLTAIVKDETEQDQLFDAVNNFPSIQSKINWMRYWTNTETRTFAERLIVFAAVEGIFFSGAFCAVFWLKKRGLLPGLSFEAGELVEIQSKEDIEQACLQESNCRFWQASDTPSLQPPLFDVIGPLGFNPAGDAILNGTFEIQVNSPPMNTRQGKKCSSSKHFFECGRLPQRLAES